MFARATEKLRRWVDQVACGAGVVNTSHPQTGDNEVVKRGDTSDPGADCTYGAGGDDCPSPTCKPCTPTGQGGDTKGKIVRSVGNGSSDVSGVQFRIRHPHLVLAPSVADEAGEADVADRIGARIDDLHPLVD